MRTNQTVDFKVRNFDELSEIPYITQPKGDLLTISMNPFTGQVYVSYQDNPDALAFLDLILDQMFETMVNSAGLSRRSPTFREFLMYCKEVS